MSYECPDSTGVKAPMIYQFSNPALSYNGFPAGTAASANCARRLGETRNIIAAARPAKPSLAFGSLVSWLDGRRCLDAPTWDSGRQVNTKLCTMR